jgi:hypothetical protein
MWAIVVVHLGLLSGPQALPITDAGTFKSEAACAAALKAAIPAKLDVPSRAEFDRGERRYVCVRVNEHGALPPH